MPITTAGDRDRKSPFGQIGERGVFVKEIEEALLAGPIDVAVHSAKDMTSTDTDGLVGRRVPRARRPARRAVGADEIRPGMRIGTASVRRRRSCSRSTRRSRSSRCAATSTRACARRASAGSTRSCSPRCGLDRLGLADEIGLRIPRRRDAPRGGAGRARAAGARRRGGARRARRPRRDAPPRRGRARVRRARSAPAASRRSRRTTTASGSRR